MFYVVPMSIFIEHDLIATGLTRGKISLNIDSNIKWLEIHQFSYLTINEEIHKNKLINIFKLN